MILKSPMNAMHNVTNPCQGPEKRVLCLCSAGLLRSARLSQILQQNYKYNTRSAGVADYALIPVNTALLKWADEIVCVEQEIYDKLLYDIKNIFNEQDSQVLAIQAKTIILNIPDVYHRMDYELGEMLKEQYEQERLT